MVRFQSLCAWLINHRCTLKYTLTHLFPICIVFQTHGTVFYTWKSVLSGPIKWFLCLKSRDSMLTHLHLCPSESCDRETCACLMTSSQASKRLHLKCFSPTPPCKYGMHCFYNNGKSHIFLCFLRLWNGMLNWKVVCYCATLIFRYLAIAV